MTKKAEFRGTIIAITKVDDTAAQAYKVTLDSEVYLEVNNIKDRGIFEKLCEIGDLKGKIRITIEKA
jgi:hypothetical protein